MNLSNYPNGASDFEPNFYGETYQCDGCDAECSHEEEPATELKGKRICPDCRESCSGYCGEFISDESIESFGKVVTFRDPTGKGKRVCAHAECAAEYLLMMMGVPDKDSSREEIDAAVAPELAAAQVMTKYPNCDCIPSSTHRGWWVIVKQLPVYSPADILENGRTQAEAWIDAAKVVAQFDPPDAPICRTCEDRDDELFRAGYAAAEEKPLARRAR